MTIRAVAPPCVFKSLLAALLLGIMLLQHVAAQNANPFASPPAIPIERQLAAIQIEERRNEPAEKLGYLWANLATAYHNAGDFDQALAADERALHLLAKVPAARANYATALDNLGGLYLEYGRMEEARAARKKAWTLRREIGDPLDVARSKQHLSEIDLALHRFKDAEKGSLEAYATLSSVPAPTGRETVSTLLSALVTLTFAQCSQPKCDEGLRHAEQAMQIVRSRYPPESVELAHVSMALGFALWKTGATEQAEHNMTEGIRILRARLGDRNRMLLAAMYEYRGYLEATHRDGDLAQLDKQLGWMTAREARASCVRCTVSAYALQ